MLTVELDHCAGVATIHCGGAINYREFHQAQLVLRPFLRKHNHLNGLLWQWHSVPYCRYVDGIVDISRWLLSLNGYCRQHAIVTNSALGDLLAKLSTLIKHTQVRHFPAVECDRAKWWLRSSCGD